MYDDSFVNFKNRLLLLTVLFVPALTIESRSVNIAVETSFVFDPQDVKGNATFLHRLKSVIDKLNSALAPQTPVFRQEVKEKVLTDFLAEVGSALIHLDDKDVKIFTEDFSSVVQELLKNNADLEEIVEEKQLISAITKTVQEWAETDPMKIKVEIAKYLTSDNNNAAVKFLNILNKFYDETDEVKMKKLLNTFSDAAENKDFNKFLSKTIDFIIFKRYKKSNNKLRQIFKQELKKFTGHLSPEYKTRGDEENNQSQRRYSLKKIARSQNFSGNSQQDSVAGSSVVEDSVVDNSVVEDSVVDNSVVEDSNPVETTKNPKKDDDILLDENLNMAVHKEDDDMKLELNVNNN